MVRNRTAIRARPGGRSRAGAGGCCGVSVQTRRKSGLGFARSHRRLGYLLAAALLVSPAAARAQPADLGNQPVLAPSALAAAMARYRRDLAAYMQAQASYTAAAEAYWSAIAEKRHLRAAKRASHEPISLDDYVLTQPPVYSGPPKPRDSSKPHEEAPPAPAIYVPVVADFLAAAQREFK